MAKMILCPMCGQPATQKDIPFCSSRCADLDLGRWFKGAYTIPVVDMDDVPDDEEGGEAPPQAS